MTDETLHRAQLSILYTLRHNQDASFSTLMRPTGMQSDSFKFHLRKLVRAGYVRKKDDGSYTLTPLGKEYANNLDKARRSTQKQPKLSVLIVVTDPNMQSEPRYLLQQRSRNPYFGY